MNSLVEAVRYGLKSLLNDDENPVQDETLKNLLRVCFRNDKDSRCTF